MDSGDHVRDGQVCDVVLRELPCSTCGTVTSFERPPCPDSHGDECPEWCCTACGEALLIGGLDEVHGDRASGARHGRGTRAA